MESLIDATYFQRPSAPALLTTLALALLLIPQQARADDAVLVLPTGPTRHAQVVGVSESPDGPEAVKLGDVLLLEAALGAAPVRDFKILPDGRNLLSGADGRGVLITDALGQPEFSLAPQGERQRVSSASVSAYAAPGEVARLLVTDSNRSQALVIDPRAPDARLEWIKSFALPGARADFVDGISLPGQRAAIAINWSTLGVSAIDIYQTQSGYPQTELRRIAGAPHPNQPEDLVLVPELEQLRAIMGLASGNLLVTTQFSLFEMDLEGDIKWQIMLGQDAVDQNGDALSLRGEFSDATILPSGHIAVSTLQSGVWTSPHINHRIYWLSASALERSEIEVIARTSALDFAPARIEARDGHGGSGTIGFRPGLDAPNNGSLSDLELSRPLSLNQPNYLEGEFIRPLADIKNNGESPILLSSALILANSGACGAQTSTSVTVFEAVAVEIAPDEVFALRGMYTVDDAFTPGRWCARVYAQDTLGERVELGTPITFDILSSAEVSDSTVVTEDLDFWPGEEGDGSGGEPGEDPTPPDFPTTEDGLGCGCAAGSAPGSLPAGGLAFLLTIGLGWARRRAADSSRR